MEILEQNSKFSEHALLGCKVTYGYKDQILEVESKFHHQPDMNAVAVWLKNAFTKHTDFTHEDEFRLLLVNLKCPGGLADNTKTLDDIKENFAIASAITASGTF